MMILYFAVIILLGASVRYALGVTNACLVVGKALSSANSKTGFQNAITPPMLTNVSILLWVITAVSLATVFWRFGLFAGFAGLICFVLTTVIVGALFVPAAESPQNLKLIFNSLANRYANFERSGDKVRAQAARELLARIEERHSEVLEK